MRDQHAIHRGLTSHFKIPRKPAPKSSTQFRPSVHQRLGPPVGRKKVTSPFGTVSRTNHETAISSPTHTSQEVHFPGTSAEGPGVDHLRVPANEGVLVGARLAVIA